MNIFHVLCGIFLSASGAYGNDSTQLENKIRGGNPGDQRSADSSVYLVYITKDGIPVCTGIIKTGRSVITIAEHVSDMNRFPQKYKVHYRQPDGSIGTANFKIGKAHEKYDADHKSCAYNVAMIVTVEKMSHGERWYRDYEVQPHPLVEMNPVSVLGWNTANFVNQQTTGNLTEIIELKVNMEIGDNSGSPALILEIDTPAVTLNQIDLGSPVIFGRFVLGIISDIARNSDGKICMARTVDFNDLFVPKCPEFKAIFQLMKNIHHDYEHRSQTE